MEVIRTHLEVDRWVLFGGSWGSTLALVYAETHPERVLNMVLRGIFLCRQEDLDWFYKPGGANRVFPDAWEEFINHLRPHFPEHQQTELLKHAYQCLTGEDEVARMAVAKAWSEWEAKCATLQPNPNVVNHLTNPHVAMSLARIEAHYFINHIFLEENQILNSADRLAEIPGVIVHGRYDMVCPLDNAYALKKAWPKAELEIVREAGHSAFEPGMVHALVTATNTIAGHYSIPS
jgi:proline iminopeptidase